MVRSRTNFIRLEILKKGSRGMGISPYIDVSLIYRKGYIMFSIFIFVLFFNFYHMLPSVGECRLNIEYFVYVYFFFFFNLCHEPNSVGALNIKDQFKM